MFQTKGENTCDVAQRDVTLQYFVGQPLSMVGGKAVPTTLQTQTIFGICQQDIPANSTKTEVLYKIVDNDSDVYEIVTTTSLSATDIGSLAAIDTTFVPTDKTPFKAVVGGTAKGQLKIRKVLGTNLALASVVGSFEDISTVAIA
jgi:hypothetical protein